ncbi:MAG: hypothetical protein KatS3mg102_1093 [Planctomycetota bacterium]|nr:MAG: hypothetical protein KatS3mg102_1093 [Planctomycetota bacterium]
MWFASTEGRGRGRGTAALLWAAALGGALLVPGAARAEHEGSPLGLAARLPAARTLLFASVRGLQEVGGELEPTDLGRLWERLGAFRRALAEGLAEPWAELCARLQEQTGVAPAALGQALAGGLELAVLAPPQPAPAGTPPGGMAARRPVLVVALGAAYRGLLERLAEQARARASGPPLATAVLEQDAAALLVLGSDGSVLLEPGGEGSLAAAAALGAARRLAWGEQGRGLGLVFVHVRALLAELPEDAAQPRRVLRATGLEGLGAVALGLAVEHGRLREALALVHEGEPRGLLQLLAAPAPLDPLRAAQQVPADAMGFAVLNVELPGLYERFAAMAEQIEPGSRARWQQALDELELQIGFSPVEDLLQALDGPLVLEWLVPEDGLGLVPEAVLSLAVRDAARLARTLEQAAALLGAQVRTLADPQGGAPVRYLSMPLGRLGERAARGGEQQRRLALGSVWSALAGAWTIERDRLYLSALPQTLLERRARLAARGRMPVVEPYKRAAAQMPGGARAFAFSRRRQTVGALYHLGLRALRALEPALRQGGLPVDAALLPRPAAVAELFEPGVTSWVVREDGMVLVSQGGGPLLATAALGAGLGAARWRLEQQARAERLQVQQQVLQEHQAALQRRLAGADDPELQAELRREIEQLRAQIERLQAQIERLAGVRRPAEPAAGGWHCPMHPEVRTPDPGVCPVCGMELVPAPGTPPAAAPGPR